ncbi:SDR family NAD(P)-dependent oxidoreductase [Brevibacterium zhoupengii]|uniref:SDR family NAD(P)-dependent oxidoreductase n=1 Tax=Brevibacterium zhoupengii TaxID=2898795 RepID=UPI001E3E8E7E|nr:SDR family oxidoreductase [Brevibacterium zhoupengii]
MNGTKVLLIGCVGGLGSATAGALRERGAQVVGLDRADLDLGLEHKVSKVIRETWQKLGPFDSLVHAAGIFPALPMLETSEDDFRRIMTINAGSAFAAASAFSRLCIDGHRSGNIVMVSSGAARRPRKGLAAYGASKAALESIVRSVALEMGPHGIRCNAVAPGFVDVKSTINPIPESYIDAIARSNLHRRVAKPADVIPAIVWLLTPESGWINGQSIPVDGGDSIGASSEASWTDE